MLAHYQRDSDRPQLIDTSWQLAPTILSRAERTSRKTTFPVSSLPLVATRNVARAPVGAPLNQPIAAVRTAITANGARNGRSLKIELNRLV